MGVRIVGMAEPTETWQRLLRELFTGEMKSRWGWGRVLRGAHGTEPGVAAETSRASIDTDGLDIPYFCGRISVDFAQRAVKCDAFDQKTPADEQWELHPESSWWERALSCEWPLRGA